MVIKNHDQYIDQLRGLVDKKTAAYCYMPFRPLVRKGEEDRIFHDSTAKLRNKVYFLLRGRRVWQGKRLLSKTPATLLQIWIQVLSTTRANLLRCQRLLNRLGKKQIDLKWRLLHPLTDEQELFLLPLIEKKNFSKEVKEQRWKSHWWFYCQLQDNDEY